MLDGRPGQRKALLKELIVEVRIESRDSIIPTFRLPASSVRLTENMVGDPGLEPGWITPHAPQTCASTSSASRPPAAHDSTRRFPPPPWPAQALRCRAAR